METQENLVNVEIDTLSIPIYIFHEEGNTIEGNLNYISDENGLITLITPEEEAKDILYSIATPSKEDQEIMNKMINEDMSDNRKVVEIKDFGKSYVKDVRYNLSLMFVGNNEETGNPQFLIVQDTISGDFNKTKEIIAESSIS